MSGREFVRGARRSLGCLVFAAAVGALHADDRTISYERDVEPLLRMRCGACHGPEKQQSHFRIDRRAVLLAGGDRGEPAVIPGKADESPLIRYVSGVDADLVMPPKGERLTADQIQTLRLWIDQGLKMPEQAGAAEEVHWAFRPLGEFALPRTPEPSDNAVDAFVAARLARDGLTISREADRRTLIRRLFLVQWGLPPTPEQVAEFLADPAGDAYERLVDRVLASPHYGERMARHWLDAVRFAESDGFETNQPRPNAWPYRDYVIRAFNENLPYDRFVLEQLAGDQLGQDAATGFLVGGAWDRVKSPDLQLTLQQRSDELHDMVSTTGATFLGLTIGCARCHNHKFDPIPQTDYYAVQAVFAGVQHGERPVPPPDAAARRERALALRAELQAIEADLRRFEPRAALAATRWLDDAQPPTSRPDAPRVEPLVPPAESLKLQAGTARGQQQDPGDLARLPTLSDGFSSWTGPPGRPVLAYAPRLSGKHRIWLSWGCGRSSHCAQTEYLLDRDGQIETTDDQTVIATVDQRHFAPNPGLSPGAHSAAPGGDACPEEPRWSGFFDAGFHEFSAETRLLVRGRPGAGGAVTADVVVFQQEEQAAADPQPVAAKPQPALRDAPTSDVNVERFEPVAARFVRMTILNTNLYEPCLDELEVFEAGPSPANVALAAAGAVAWSSSNYPHSDIHKLEHLNDGQYGNSRSWISNEPNKGWVEIEFPRVVTIDRVVWSRDRKEKRFDDRTATDYRIEVSLDGSVWKTVASSGDRLPFALRGKFPTIRTGAEASAGDAQRLPERLVRKRALELEIASLEAMPMVYAGTFAQPPPTHRLHRGDPLQPREPIAPGGLTRVLEPLALPADLPEPERRAALARWMTSGAQPLAARVIVNRIWQWNFGTGIVATPSDFGVNGARPTHPELLDVLARDFIASGWDVKRLQRKILLSRTFRQASAPRDDALRVDAGSRLLWRYPPRRLEAEPLRDSILAAAGTLDVRMGGPGFDLFQPNTNYVKVYTSRTDFGPGEWRRMVYQSKPRMQLDNTFGPFDCPDAGQIAPRRTASTTPLQSLALLNSPFLLQQAELLAQRITRDAGADPRAQIRRAFQLVLQRDPSHAEAAATEAFLKEQSLADLCRALLNANEFLFVF